ACRNPDGQIVIHETELNQKVYRGRLAKTPFLRGVVLLWDALGLGTRALMWSADVALDEEEAAFEGPLGWGTMAVSFTIAIGLFFLLPLFASRGIDAGVAQLFGTSGAEGIAISFWQSFTVNALEGVVRLIMIIGYIWAIGHLPDVKRLFGYHGAEHKTINAYEAGDDLTSEVVARYPIEHPRCGTAFLLNVAVVSILVFAILGNPGGWVGWVYLVVTRIVFIPVIAGIAYEWLRWTAKNSEKGWVSWLIKPNLALQHLTTNEPDDGMIETAIVAFKRVLLSEGMIEESEAQIPDARPEMANPMPGAAD
ncbi:MAG: DUF1385 domain-containing protein, partial [Chloroflexota bacterium]